MSFLFGGTPFDGYKNGTRSLSMGGGGSSGPTSTTTQTSNIPDWLRPQVEAAIGASTQQLFNTTQNADGTQTLTGLRGYVPYSTNPSDYVAGFSPMQNQAFQSAANLQTPGQFGAASDLAASAGQGALGTTGAAMGYGSMGAGYGQQGANIGTTQGLGYGAMGAGYGAQGAGTAGTALGYGANAAGIGNQAVGASGQGFNAGANYQRMATDPNSIQAYMNPYVAASMAPQLQLMNQQLAQTQAQNQAQAVKQGAYGGSRQAVQQGLTQQNADLAKQQLIAQGYDTAFKNAQQAQQFGSTLGIQGLQAGTQALQAGIQGQQAGLQGVQGAQAGYAQGIQGAQAGLQGTNAALAGTAQGIQGAQAGLQGVQGAQAGYNIANQSAQNLGQLGTQQLAAQQAIINQQNTFGAQQQAQEQQIINNAINNYAMAQNYPQQQLAFYNSMIRGYATPTTSTSQYLAAPNTTSQLAGLAATGLGAYGAAGGFRAAKGGPVKGDGLDDIGMYLAMKGKK